MRLENHMNVSESKCGNTYGVTTKELIQRKSAQGNEGAMTWVIHL